MRDAFSADGCVAAMNLALKLDGSVLRFNPQQPKRLSRRHFNHIIIRQDAKRVHGARHHAPSV